MADRVPPPSVPVAGNPTNTGLRRSLMRHIRATLLAFVIVGIACTANVFAAPTTVTLSTHSKQVSAAECAQWHKSMASNKRASADYQAWGRSKSTNDCVIVSGVTTQVANSSSASAWDGCYNRQSYEQMTSGLWPYPTLATAYMNSGLCWPSTETQLSLPRSWAPPFPPSRAPQSSSAGAP